MFRCLDPRRDAKDKPLSSTALASAPFSWFGGETGSVGGGWILGKYTLVVAFPQG